MATAAQIAANRANAQQSTGPRSVEGKAASSMNALKHGADAKSPVIPGEDPEQYDRLAAEYRRDIAPGTALESFQVDTLIRADWERRRLKRIEANCYRELLAEGQNPEEIDIKILRDSPTGKLLLRIIARIASLERSHSRASAWTSCSISISRLRRFGSSEFDMGFGLPLSRAQGCFGAYAH